jgi:RNA polymerase sigma-70 factor (ECF subfamily)
MTTMPLVDPLPEQDLIRAMRLGDAAAFAQLYRTFSGPVYRFALLRSGAPETADDIVQDVFTGLFTGNLQYDPLRGSLQPFLIGVARNLLLKRDEARARTVPLPESPDGEDQPGEAEDLSASPLQRLLQEETAEAVRCALARLKPHYRDVVILFEMHDLSYVEIAQICAIDIGTVRSRLSRARSHLARLLVDTADAAMPTPLRQRKAGP